MSGFSEKQPVSIIVDDREGKSRIPDLLKLHRDIRIEIERLPYGDYLVNGHLLIERKTMPDFSLSVTSGRLFQQAACMCLFPYWRILILEGNKNHIHGISRQAMRGAVMALSLWFDLPVLYTMHEKETADLIVASIKYIAIPYNENQVFIRPGIKQIHKKGNNPVHILEQMPGIGRRRAKTLMNHFGSIQVLANADMNQLCEVRGIGTGTAETIFRLVREESVKVRK